jgi:hypothetical protein
MFSDTWEYLGNISSTLTCKQERVRHMYTSHVIMIKPIDWTYAIYIYIYIYMHATDSSIELVLLRVIMLDVIILNYVFLIIVRAVLVGQRGNQRSFVCTDVVIRCWLRLLADNNNCIMYTCPFDLLS